MLGTIDPAFLLVPQRLLDLLPPTAFGYREGIAERFPTATGGFDPVRAAVVAADLAVSGLLEPSRAARLQQFHAEDPAAPDFTEIVGALVSATWGRPAPPRGLEGLIARAVQDLVVTRLMQLTAGEAPGDVREVSSAALRRLAGTLAPRTDAHSQETRDAIARFLERPGPPRTPATVPPAPAGEPIG